MQTIAVVENARWEIDWTRSTIGFKVKHLSYSTIRGEFKKFGAKIYSSGIDFLNTAIDFWINPASVTTGDAARDLHLKSAEIFNVQKYKEINFSAIGMESIGDGMYALHGELTIKSITKKLRLEVELNRVVLDAFLGQRVGFVVTGKINRTDWGLSWNDLMESGCLIAGEDVFIYCEIELTKRSGRSRKAQRLDNTWSSFEL